MPLHDHFHGRFRGFRTWEVFHDVWINSMMRALNQALPARFRATTSVHLGVAVAPDVAAFEHLHHANGHDPAPAWTAPAAHATLALAPPACDEFAIEVVDTLDGERLVAAVELVSPRNKDRATARTAFVAKCSALLARQVTVALVDVVTTRQANLHAELLQHLQAEQAVAPLAAEALYASVYQNVYAAETWHLAVWAYELALAAPLPTLPLWIAPEWPVPLDLEATYLDAGRALRLF
jgi:hypothetical protein